MIGILFVCFGQNGLGWLKMESMKQVKITQITCVRSDSRLATSVSVTVNDAELEQIRKDIRTINKCDRVLFNYEEVE